MSTPEALNLSTNGQDWIPAACTLPTVEQPIRVAEFDDLFASSVEAVDRLGPTSLRLTLDAGAEAHARDLAGRESSCCSFFTFDFGPETPDTVTMQVAVPSEHVAVLDAFAARARAAAGLTSTTSS